MKVEGGMWSSEGWYRYETLYETSFLLQKCSFFYRFDRPFVWPAASLTPETSSCILKYIIS
jgi:hypothetical protein